MLEVASQDSSAMLSVHEVSLVGRKLGKTWRCNHLAVTKMDMSETRCDVAAAPYNGTRIATTLYGLILQNFMLNVGSKLARENRLTLLQFTLKSQGIYLTLQVVSV